MLPVFDRAAQIALLTVTATACVKQLPPAPTPEPVAPAVATAAPPAAGQGRLIVDVVEGPTPVHRVLMQPTQTGPGQGRVRFRFLEQPELMCSASPCVVDLPPGNLLLGFPVIGRDGLESELVHVGPGTSVYRRSLSVREDRTGKLRVLGIIATAVGGTALMTGAALLPIGLAEDIDGMTTAGGITLGAGAAFLVWGIWAMRHDAPTFRPGSSNHFPLNVP